MDACSKTVPNGSSAAVPSEPRCGLASRAHLRRGSGWRAASSAMARSFMALAYRSSFSYPLIVSTTVHPSTPASGGRLAR